MTLVAWPELIGSRSGKEFSVPEPAASVAGVGPQAAISCPPGAIQIAPGKNIQTFVDTYPGRTVFCLRAGVHPITSAITPKTGNTFVGQYGAILNGTGWTTEDSTQGAFRAHNEDIDDVTIKNLVIRNMPQRGIHAFRDFADRWTIDYNELEANATGVVAPNSSVVRNNYIHDNSRGGYSLYRAKDITFEGNEVSHNGGEQKVVAGTNVTFRNNFVHDNESDGIWYDFDNVGALIEGNIVEDNGRDGISYEASGQGIIRNNIVRRSGSSGIFISTSMNVEISGNSLEDNFRGIQYFVNCEAVRRDGGAHDLANNTAHHNTITISTKARALASALMSVATCNETELAPYLNGSKKLVFSNNHYVVPSATTKYWHWGRCCPKSWSEWQALGHDTDERK